MAHPMHANAFVRSLHLEAVRYDTATVSTKQQGQRPIHLGTSNAWFSFPIQLPKDVVVTVSILFGQCSQAQLDAAVLQLDEAAGGKMVRVVDYPFVTTNDTPSMLKGIDIDGVICWLPYVGDPPKETLVFTNGSFLANRPEPKTETDDTRPMVAGRNFLSAFTETPEVVSWDSIAEVPTKFDPISYDVPTAISLIANLDPVKKQWLLEQLHAVFERIDSVDIFNKLVEEITPSE